MNILQQVIMTAININNSGPENETRLEYASKEDADSMSEELKEFWPSGFGQVYGPFVSYGRRWYEVSIPRQSI